MSLFKSLKQSISNAFNSAKEKLGGVVRAGEALVVSASVSAVSLLASSDASADATLPAAVGTTITGIGTNAQALFDLAFPVIGTIVGLVVVIKLFKKFTGKI